MQAFGITVKHLQTAKPAKSGKGSRSRNAPAKSAKLPKAAKKAGAQVAAKYRGPNGETWSGRGLTPKWLVSLVAQGQSKEAFLIASN
jgi:DNA-binding protein H-NS